jgi:molybdopterin-binding protein
MKTGARNKIIGKVSAIKKGTLMCQVSVKSDKPVELSSVMTLDSLEELGVKPGDQVTVVVKAVSVLLIKE